MLRCFPDFRLLLGLTLALGGAASCAKDSNEVLLFTAQDDNTLGERMATTTDSIYRAKSQLLDQTANAQAYTLLNQITNRVLDAGQLEHRTDFDWTVQILNDNTTANAFVTPGGHLYITSGLIKYLDNEQQLAGVLAHEIAHADRRHPSRQLQQQYGINMLLSVVLGNNPKQVVTLASGQSALSFSAAMETEADTYSVRYLNATSYYTCDGAGGFFTKAIAATTDRPVFLNAHTGPDSRVTDLQAEAQRLGCTGRTSTSTAFTQLKALLP